MKDADCLEVKVKDANKRLKSFNKKEVKVINLILRKGEIRKYVKNLNFFGDYNLGYCLILDDSYLLNEKVLICPLIEINEIQLNNIYMSLSDINDFLIDGHKMVASISDIKFISKRKFIEYLDNVDLNAPIKVIDLVIVAKIITNYANMLSKIILKIKKEKILTC